MIAQRSILLLGLSLILAACQTPGPDPAVSATSVKAGAGGTVETISRPQAYAIGSSADINDLVAAALAHHPSLHFSRAHITALEQSAIQARILPDPSASFGAGSMAETAAGQVVGSVGVQQRIPYPGKRRAESLRILSLADAMRGRLKAEELALAERVRIAYWNFYAARRTVAVVTEGKKPLTTLRESVEARIAVSKASQQDLLRLENEITRLDQRLVTAKGRERAARASLNALLYRPSGSPLPVPRGSAFPQYGSTSTMLARAQERHPEVLAAQARIAAAEKGVRLAQLKRRPDFTAGLSWLPVSDSGLAPSANGRDQVMATLGLSLPIWDEKNKAAGKEAAANLSAEHSALASTRSSLQQRIESSSASYQAEMTNLGLFADKLLPDAQQGFELSLTSYQAETSTFLDVVDAWRQLLNYQLEHEENRGRAGKAEAALRFSAGLP